MRDKSLENEEECILTQKDKLMDNGFVLKSWG